MKNIVLIIITVLMMVTIGYAKVTPDTVLFSGANPQTGAGESNAVGGDRTYSAVTCQIDGTSGTMNVDIDGSIDGTTYRGMYDNITAVGTYSVVNQPFNYYKIDIDACSGACSLTIKCQTKEVN